MATPRKAPQDRKTKKPKVEEGSIVFTLNGSHYKVVISELTGLEIKAFREQVGLSPLAALSSEDKLDIDVVAGFIWLVRRRTEPAITYQSIAGGMTYGSSIDIDFGGNASEVDTADPEA